MIYFTSDWHFFHDRILDFHARRKELFGTDIKEVTEKMILLWNNTVSKKDTVYILGDLSFGTVEQKRKLFNRLNGNKVLILGNHDSIPTEQRCFFNHISQIKNMAFKKSNIPELSGNMEIIMCHFPMYRWEHCNKGSIMLHGHCHGKIDQDNKLMCEHEGLIRIDVGLDGELANYNLVSITKLNDHIQLLKETHYDLEKEI